MFHATATASHFEYLSVGWRTAHVFTHTTQEMNFVSHQESGKLHSTDFMLFSAFIIVYFDG